MFKKVCYYIGHWESWHWLAKYIPIIPVWIWYCIRSRSMWFFTPSNPTLSFGGFLGETKQEVYKQLPVSSYPKSIYIAPTQDFNSVKKAFASNNFVFPVAVKPDAGMMGFMFRKIDSQDQLNSYHNIMPVDYILQEFVNFPLEVSVFYYRYPGDHKGTITGFLKKEFLQVTGNGSSTLWELMEKYSRINFRLDEMKAKHRNRLNDVIPEGEIFCLSPALNLSRGGKLISLATEKDDRLLKIFDNLSHYTKSFYYGRYDIKCNSIEELKQGINFSILEYNGSGAEPHHVYGDGNSLLKAYSILIYHWKVLYRISKLNNNLGIPYWGFIRGLNYSMKAKQHFKILSQLDTQFQL